MVRWKHFVGWCFVLGLARCQAQLLSLHNPLSEDRQPEVIEIPLGDVLSHTHLSTGRVSEIVASDAATGRPLSTQIYSTRFDQPPDQLLVLVHLKAHATISLALKAGAPLQAKPLVFGRDAPERKDDFAWENELVTYRVYGPALEATGEIASGIDVWSKRVPDFVIDTFYKRDAEGTRTHNPELSYHKDNGQGLDSYFVGPTRGCGGTAVLELDKLYSSRNYAHLRMLANGPLRFAFEVTYAPWDAEGTAVTETKQIVLDASTHLNRITSTYSFSHGGPLRLVAGIAVHEGATAEFPVKDQIAAVWDTPQDASAGRIATGLLALSAEHARTVVAAGHALLEFSRKSGAGFTYYAGAGWSKADMPTSQAWVDYLRLRLNMLEHPVVLEWRKN